MSWNLFKIGNASGKKILINEKLLIVLNPNKYSIEYHLRGKDAEGVDCWIRETTDYNHERWALLNEALNFK